MSIKKEQLRIRDINIDLSRKDIKNIHLSVHPPQGQVRISAPQHLDTEVLRRFAISKLAWIKKQQKSFQEQQRESPRDYIDGESHFLWGQRYLLDLVEEPQQAPEVSLRGGHTLEMQVRPDATRDKKDQVMREWYRQELKERIPPLIEKWEKIMGVNVQDWGVKRMKTKCGSCNPSAGRIWLNLELAKKSPKCLEYIIVHELIHLLEPSHNARFYRLMDTYMPNWRVHRAELNRVVRS